MSGTPTYSSAYSGNGAGIPSRSSAAHVDHAGNLGADHTGPMTTGTAINPDRLRYEMTRRGITASELAGRANITPHTISNMMRGGAARAATFRKLVRALVSFPVLDGANLILDPPDGHAPADPYAR